MRYIKINFQSAKLVIDDSNYKIKVTDKNFVDMNHLIKIEPISNMLHVLLGERPVATNKITFNKRINFIDDVVKNGYVKIDSALSYKTNSGDLKPNIEFTQGKKSVWDSHMTNIFTKINENENTKGYMNWGQLKRRFLLNNKEKYYLILDKINEYSPIKNPWEEMSLSETFNLIRTSERKHDFLNFLIDIKQTPLALLLKGDSDCSSLNKNYSCNLSAKTVNLYVLKKITVNGSFLLPFDEQLKSNLFKGQGVATYLDGGMADLDYNIYEYDEDTLIFENYKKITT